MNSLQLILTTVLSVGIGFTMGTMGAGGGTIYTILLTFFLGLPIDQAVGTALAISTLSTISAVIGYWRNKNVKGHYILYLGGPGIVGVICGSLLISYIPLKVLKCLVGIVFLLISLVSLMQVKKEKQSYEESTSLPTWREIIKLVVAGFILGVISGTFGVSGTSPLSSFLSSCVWLPIQAVIGITLTVTLLINLIGTLVHYQQQTVNLPLSVVIGLGSAAGAYWGSKFSAMLNRKVLVILISTLTLITGIAIVFRWV